MRRKISEGDKSRVRLRGSDPSVCGRSGAFSLIPSLSKCVPFPASTQYLYCLLDVGVHADADLQYVRVAWIRIRLSLAFRMPLEESVR